MNADATARYVITADDRTKAALANIKRGFDDLEKRVGAFRRAATLGFGAVSIAGVARYTTQLADAAQQARDTTGSFNEMRESLGAFSSALSDDDLTRLAELGDAFDRARESAQQFGATIVSRVSPVLQELADGIRVLMGGATDLEKLQTQLDYLARVKDRPEGILSFGGFAGMDTGWNSRSDVRDAFGRLSAQRDAILSQMQRMRSGDVVGDLGEVTVTADGSDLTSRRSNAAAAAREAAAKAAQDAANAARKFQETIDSGTRDALDKMYEGMDERHQEQVERVRANMQAWREAAREATDGMSVYADQAARNMQDAFAQFLFDPFKGGVRGMLSSFADALRQMAAQAAAAKIFESIGGAGGVRGIIGSALSFFGGARAEGGPVTAGRAYLVGERGPELFVPGASGGIVPNNRIGSEPVVNVTANYIMGANTVSREELLMFARRNNEELTKSIVEGIRRRKYLI